MKELFGVTQSRPEAVELFLVTSSNITSPHSRTTKNKTMTSESLWTHQTLHIQKDDVTGLPDDHHFQHSNSLATEIATKVNAELMEISFQNHPL